MKSDIVISGVGGQGILSIATVLGSAALEKNLYLKQAETHGMSQRGGAVQSFLRLSSDPIFSDLIPMGHADLILSVEPMETLRYLSYLGPEGVIVTSTVPFVNIDDYPDHAELMKRVESLPRVVAIDADAMAREAGNVKASNIVILGAGSKFIDIEPDVLERAIVTIFARKGEATVQLNLKAFRLGREFAEATLKNFK